MEEASKLRPAFRAATAETVIGLLAVSGMRSGEVLRLNHSDVDLSARTIKVITTKGNKSRELCLHESTAVALSDYARLREARLRRRQLTEFLRLKHRPSAEREHAPRHLQALGGSGRAGAAARIEGAPPEATRCAPQFRR